MQRYVGLVHQGDRRWGVSFPDFPGCIATGGTFEEAVDSAARALRFHVEGMLLDGLQIPRPTPLDAILRNPELSDDVEDGVVTVVPLLPPREGAERVNISVDRGLLREIDQAVEMLGSSRSSFLADAARDRLEFLTVSVEQSSLRSSAKPELAGRQQRTRRRRKDRTARRKNSAARTRSLTKDA